MGFGIKAWQMGTLQERWIVYQRIISSDLIVQDFFGVGAHGFFALPPQY